ncbi:tRNA pseudouridine(55) synthase TruB [Candidatus Gracilibacteria bacterium]|nr:tRNA pseudouridine(55) synthase TruB [Candidatus Gracilibacteria bacterium]
MILYIDKPSGMTSFDVIRQLRKRLNIRKMGHAGTLDPLATGLLIIAVEKDTKRINEFMNLDKEYEVMMELGKISDSYDADGELTEVSKKIISREEIEVVIKEFIGTISQVPPAYSAIKVKGVRAYDRARAGEAVVLEPRQVRIDAIDIVQFDFPFVALRVRCAKGTYVRSLVHDIGQKLEVGAYVKSLRRTAIGPHRVETAQKLEAF